MGENHKSRNQGVEAGMVLPSVTPSDLLEEFGLPILMTLSSMGFEVLILKGEIILTGDIATTPLNYKCG